MPGGFSPNLTKLSRTKGHSPAVAGRTMESLSKALLSLYRGTPFHKEWIVAYLEGSWATLLGEKIARACRPLTLRRQELVVEVLDAAWMPVLGGMNEKMLEKIMSATGEEVQEISFRLRRAQ